MIHKHFEQIHSTQDFLLESHKGDERIELVSCETQTEGHGQYDRKWDSFKQSLCFSALISPNKVLTLTSLEIGCLILKYFKTNYQVDLKLKWPNDILNKDGHKVGGILINNASGEWVAGIGLNFNPIENFGEYKTQAASIFSSSVELDKKAEAVKLFKFMKENRMDSIDVMENWNAHCFHIDRSIKLVDSDKTHQGEFKKIGPNGEALILINNEIQKFYSGSIIL